MEDIIFDGVSTLKPVDPPNTSTENLCIHEKFADRYVTAGGCKRGFVDLEFLRTLWFNTGTLCNLECANCYIESSPRNDKLSYITLDEVVTFLDEIERENLGTKEIGLTGGEPFMNAEIIRIINISLVRGFKVITLTNAMRPMMRFQRDLLDLKAKFGSQFSLRVSIDHYTAEMHEKERGVRTWEPMLEGLKWLSQNDFAIDIAGRTRWGEEEEYLRKGYSKLFSQNNIAIDAYNGKQLVLFPEMDPCRDVPEITTKCWEILGVDPYSMMCATSRMVIKRKGASRPSVVSCTLLPYEEEFELANTLKESAQRVHLNHPFCSKFCVLGGGSCSVTD